MRTPYHYYADVCCVCNTQFANKRVLCPMPIVSYIYTRTLHVDVPKTRVVYKAGACHTPRERAAPVSTRSSQVLELCRTHPVANDRYDWHLTAVIYTAIFCCNSRPLMPV